MTPLPFGKFLTGWVPAMAVSAVVDPVPRLADLFAIDLGGGVLLPPVTCLLGLLGVVAGRPLARRQESALSWPMFILVTAILVVTIELWIVESRPGALFTFVIAIGLGFSGYSLIELVTNEVRDFLRGLVTRTSAGLRAGADRGAGGAKPLPSDSGDADNG